MLAAYSYKRIASAALLALLTLLSLEVFWFFVIPHGTHFAPEIGPWATSIYFALVLSCQLFVGLSAGLLFAVAYLYSFTQAARRPIECAVFVGAALVASGIVVYHADSTVANITLTLSLFLIPFVVAAVVLTNAPPQGA